MSIDNRNTTTHQRSEETGDSFDHDHVSSSVLTATIRAGLDSVREAISTSDFDATLHLDHEVFTERVTFNYSDPATKLVLTHAILDGLAKLNPNTVTNSRVMANLLVEDARKKVENFMRNLPQVEEVFSEDRHVEKKPEPSLLEVYLSKAEALRASLLGKFPEKTTGINTDIDSLVSVIRGFGTSIPQHAVPALDKNIAKLEKKFTLKSVKDRRVNR